MAPSSMAPNSMAPSSAAFAFSLLFTLACGSAPEAPPETPIDVDKTGDIDVNKKKAAPAVEKKSAAETANVAVDERVRKMCALPEARFEFDSVAVAANAKATLDALATCFLSGPGKDKNLLIVGHADRRGETEYNFGLGQGRAASVAGFLMKAGLAEARVSTTSRGELEASGGDEAGWSRDRRVEILLAE